MSDLSELSNEELIAECHRTVAALDDLREKVAESKERSDALRERIALLLGK